MSKKFEYRFAVGSLDGPRSAAWRVWSGSRTKSDVYVVMRHVANQGKTSLHENGICYWGYTSEKALEDPARMKPFGSRQPFQWPRPSQGTGWSLPLRIVVPYSELRDNLGATHYSGNVLFIEPSAYACATEIDLTFVANGFLAPGWLRGGNPGTRVLASTLLPNGETLWISRFHHVSSSDYQNRLDRARGSLKAMNQQWREHIRESLSGPFRAGQIGEANDGSAMIVEVADDDADAFFAPENFPLAPASSG